MNTKIIEGLIEHIDLFTDRDDDTIAIQVAATRLLLNKSAAALRLIGPLVAEHEDTSCQDKSSFPCTCKWHTSEAALDEYRRNWSESDGAEQT